MKRIKTNEKAHARNKAVSAGVIHKNQAAKRKSAIAAQVAAM